MIRQAILKGKAVVYIPEEGEQSIGFDGQLAPAKWTINCAATGNMNIDEAYKFASTILEEIKKYQEA